MSEDLPMRRKVLVARVIAVSIALLLVSGYIYSQWSSSEAGIISTTEGKLQHDGSARTILECLDTAARLAREGKAATAKRIEALVDNAIKTNSHDADTAANTALAVAMALQKKGDSELASKYAVQSLVSFQQHVSKHPFTVNTGGTTAELLSRIDEAASIVMTTKQPLDAGQLESVVTLADALSAQFEHSGRERILDLAVTGLMQTDSALSQAGHNCLFTKAKLLAARGESKEVDELMNKVLGSLSPGTSGLHLNSAPEHSLLLRLIELASLLQKTDPSLASKYIAAAEQAFERIDPSALDLQERMVLTGCQEKFSEALIAAHQYDKAVWYARTAASRRPLSDAISASCTNQLIRALTRASQYAEACKVAEEAQTFYRSHSPRVPMLIPLRGIFAAEYFDALVGMRKNAQALAMINQEIKQQRAALPSSIQTLVALNTKLIDYHLSKNELKSASACARRIAQDTKSLTALHRLPISFTLMHYATAARDNELIAEMCSDALHALNEHPEVALRQIWLENFCAALPGLKESEAAELYQQVLSRVKDGFLYQIATSGANATALAKVVNELGTSGEEQTADFLRSRALEKLTAEKSQVFANKCMDFVVSADANQYAEPTSAAKVYLDLARNMKGKDNESAFKNAFEAIKIYRLVGAKNPQLQEQWFNSIDDAAAIMLQCKQAPNADQLSLLLELCQRDSEQIKKTGKDNLLQVAVNAYSKQKTGSPPPCVLSLRLILNENLAKRGQLAQLSAAVAETKQLWISQNKPNERFADHLVTLAELSAQKNEQLAARKFLGTAKSIYDENQSGAELRPPGANQADTWEKMSSIYAKAGDSQNALACFRKAVELKPAKASGTAAVVLLDRLLAAENLPEAERVASDAYAQLRNQGENAQTRTLRAACASRLYQILKKQGREEAGAKLLLEELQSREDSAVAAASPLQTAQLYHQLASYYADRSDTKSVLQCLSAMRQAKLHFTTDQRLQWEQSGVQRDLISLAAKSNDMSVLGQEILDFISEKNVDKASAIQTPEKWWARGLVSFRSDQKAHKQLLDFIKEGFNQQLARADADGAFLGDFLNDLSKIGEETTAATLREAADRKLPESKKQSFLAHCKVLPARGNASDAGNAQQATGSGSGIPEQRHEGGRLDTD